MSVPDIDRYFEQYGWHATQVAEGCWQATFRGDYATIHHRRKFDDGLAIFRH